MRARVTIVPSDEGIAVLGLQLAVLVLLRLLHGDVHVSVQARQDPFGSVGSGYVVLEGDTYGVEKVCSVADLRFGWGEKVRYHLCSLPRC